MSQVIRLLQWTLEILLLADSMDSDAEIEYHERQLEQTLLQLKMAKSVAKQFCTTDLDDFDDEKDDFEDFFK